MKTNSFVIKVFSLFFIFTLCFLLFLFTYFFNSLEKESIRNQETILRNYSALIKNSTFLQPEPSDAQAVQNYLRKTAAMLLVRITWIRTDGKVLWDTDENPEFMENHLDRPEIKNALNGLEFLSIRKSKTLRQSYVYYASPLVQNGKIMGALRLSLSIGSIERLLTGLKWKYVGVAFIFALAASFAIFSIYFFFQKHIRQFTRISEKIAQNRLDVWWPEDDSYEIRKLSQSFRNMLTRINTLIRTLETEKEESDNLIALIKEGIAVINREGFITKANAAFIRIFHAEDLLNKFYWEIIRANEVTDILKKREIDHAAVEAEIDEKIYLCSVSNLAEESVVVFYEITALRNLEKIKNDMIENILHELATPLTAIQGYTETLLEAESDPSKKKHLQIISRNTLRLEQVLSDLRLLENTIKAERSLQKKPISMGRAVQKVLPLFEQRIRQKGLTLTCSIEQDLPCFYGDAFKIEQVLINLLENAYRYTDEGSIGLSVYRENDKLIVEVRDTGIGIPENGLDRVFERFYVVDRSRSRSYNGAGIGLSIVKHIVQMHNGTITVQSRIKEGSVFVVKFPINTNPKTEDT